MRIPFAILSVAAAALALAACQPAAEAPATAPAQEPIQSTTAPSVGGPAELPTDGGVTPAPEAVEDASAADVAAAASPAQAAAMSGGEQNTEKQ
ncbi:MAG: hypothetical protein V4701_02400 [Pseudomonadota bacterium]